MRGSAASHATSEPAQEADPRRDRRAHARRLRGRRRLVCADARRPRRRGQLPPRRLHLPLPDASPPPPPPPPPPPAPAGNSRRAVSPFPSLTPVCLASIATGGGPDVHGIPHLTWYHRGERRLVEYGSPVGGPPGARGAAA